MKKLALVALALVAGGLVVGATPDSVVDAAQEAIGIVTDESDELGAEQSIERELGNLLNGTLSLLAEPLCNAEATSSTDDGSLAVTALDCRVATVEYGVVEVSAELRRDAPVLVLTDADTAQLIEVLVDPSIGDWLPLVAEPAG